MVQPRRYPPRVAPFAFDNGAFQAYRAGAAFDETAFLRMLDRAAADSARPDFVVLPDIVAGGLASLDVSARWIDRLRGWPLALAVQDGMSPVDVEPLCSDINTIFVGGSVPWKLSRGGEWVTFAHKNQLRCHVARVGMLNRLRWAMAIKADSVDSTLFLFDTRRIAAAASMIGNLSRQGDLFQ